MLRCKTYHSRVIILTLRAISSVALSVNSIRTFAWGSKVAILPYLIVIKTLSKSSGLLSSIAVNNSLLIRYITPLAPIIVLNLDSINFRNASYFQ